jgi:uncharacterized damage-inducible protein DinB
MDTGELLADAFDRVHGVVHRAVDGMTPEQLVFRPVDGTNSIAWLVWHLTRIQDDHIADAAGIDQAWTASGWVERFGLPFDPGDTGYGHGAEDVNAVRVRSGELLTGYHDAVHQQTVQYVQSLNEGDLSRVVDESWDPPVTLGVRLISVISDDLQHAGQASYVRGVGERGSF